MQQGFLLDHRFGIRRKRISRPSVDQGAAVADDSDCVILRFEKSLAQLSHQSVVVGNKMRERFVIYPSL